MGNRRVEMLLAVVICVSTGWVASVWGHGTTESPPSRALVCYLEGPENPTSAACRAAVELGGSQPIYDWNEVNIGDAAGRHRQLIPDGELCSAGNPKYAGLDLARADWPATILPATGGVHEIVYRGTAPHSTAYFDFYVTVDGYDPTRPLRWADLEVAPFCRDTDPVLFDGRYYFDCELPAGKSGRHVIYSIWQRDDSPEAFYACSDVVFGEVLATPTLRPTAVPSATAIPDPHTPTATVTPGVSVCEDRAWQPDEIYLAENRVAHRGREWRAKWWTRGEEPGTTGRWGVWQDVGPFSGSGGTPTATAVPPSATPTDNGCDGPQYVAGEGYVAGATVTNAGRSFVCVVAGWCSSPAAWAYEPGVGLYWETAWTESGGCSGTPTATADMRTPEPSATPPVGDPCTIAGWRGSEIYLVGDTVSHVGREWRAKWWTRGDEPGTTGRWGVWQDLGSCR